MEPQSFHPLDYLAVVNRRKWWFIVPLAAVHRGRRRRRGGLAEDLSLEGGDRRAVADAVGRPAARRQLDGSGRAAARDPAVAAQPDGARPGHPRGEAEQVEAGRRGRGGAAREPRAEHRGAADRSASTAVPTRPAASTSSTSATPTAIPRAPSASPTASPRSSSRRTRSSQTDRAENSADVLEQQVAAVAGAADRPRGPAARQEAELHRPAAGADRRERADGQRRAQPARVDLDADPHRAGPPQPGRVADRSDAAGRRRRRPMTGARPRGAAGGAEARSTISRRSSPPTARSATPTSTPTSTGCSARSSRRAPTWRRRTRSPRRPTATRC